MRYVTLLAPAALQRVQLALEGLSIAVPLRNAAELIAELDSPSELCVILSPALVTLVEAQEIVRRIVRFPRPVIFYTSITKEAMEAAVLFARGTHAEFIFVDSANERSALARALLLAPDMELGEELAMALQDRLAILPIQLR